MNLWNSDFGVTLRLAVRRLSSAKASVSRCHQDHRELLTTTPAQSQGGKNIKNGRRWCSAETLELCVYGRSQNTLSFCLPGKTSHCLLTPSQNGLIEILLLGKGKESWKVTPIYLKCLNQVHLQKKKKKKQQKVAIHYCITAIVCSVISDDR